MKKSMKPVLLLATAALSVVSCKDDNKEVAQTEAEKTPGIELKYMDTTVSPKTNFYDYVNGTWMKETEIPEDRTTWGGFQVLRKNTDDDVLAILAKAEKSGKYEDGTDQAKALAIFNTKLDTVARNKAGLSPLQPALEVISSIKNVKDLQEAVAKHAATVSDPFFGISAFSNPSDSNINSAYITPGNLGLPNKEYYTDQDEKSKEIRQQYVAHITRMLQYLGDSEESAKKQAKEILAFETRLAEPRLDKVASRDFRNFNNPRSIAQVQKMVPAINWTKYINDLGVEKDLDTVIVMQPKYMETLQKVLAEGNVERWKTVMRWATLNSAAGMLTTELEKANWDFYSKTLNGAKKQLPADERALSTVNGTVGEALGQLYVDEKFPPEAKAKAEEMIANVIKAYQNRIERLEWMTDSTKQKAIEKLDKFTVKIGYPDEWKDYSELAVKADQGYYQNMVAVSDWNLKDNLSEINEPVDKKEWGMSPQTVNAYFNPFNNEIVFPAAILQPPFYNYKADAAVNYGGIGAVIGHEISHAFDDSGARFDADGNLKNWWTDEDLEKFTERGDKLAEQFSDIEVLDSVYINGKYTLGENIGDLGGVLAAYDGLQMYFKEHGRPDKIDGFTPEQRFFMSWATVWRTKMREEALRSRIKTDTHSPGMYRAYVPLQNIDAFYEAFDIKEGDSMYVAPKNRVKIW
ncbi:M13 family metallopeptidase [Mesonia aestuariivivens]|uniref:M13 family metallopeptidase n=1 Tax=Mesonia aestuariivivens TaxID=2796128 RepID=A0ABS6W249_9FLAO|nr:M13 family metallopeptidase [Mesonia aestuariivivens]MBW2961913.1 M13 family metallopeptidase [Mesonia aestuariivivens]